MFLKYELAVRDLLFTTVKGVRTCPHSQSAPALTSWL